MKLLYSHEYFSLSSAGLKCEMFQKGCTLTGGGNLGHKTASGRDSTRSDNYVSSFKLIGLLFLGHTIDPSLLI